MCASQNKNPLRLKAISDTIDFKEILKLLSGEEYIPISIYILSANQVYSWAVIVYSENI